LLERCTIHTYKLVEIDLSKAHENKHPDIKRGVRYLAELVLYDKPELLYGTFSKQWYGWNFDCNWGCSGIQFDAPGYNSSPWRRLWKIVKVKKKVKR
jgi:hypothetical protein